MRGTESGTVARRTRGLAAGAHGAEGVGAGVRPEEVQVKLPSWLAAIIMKVPRGQMQGVGVEPELAEWPAVSAAGGMVSSL